MKKTDYVWRISGEISPRRIKLEHPLFFRKGSGRFSLEFAERRGGNIDAILTMKRRNGMSQSKVLISMRDAKYLFMKSFWLLYKLPNVALRKAWEQREEQKRFFEVVMGYFLKHATLKVEFADFNDFLIFNVPKNYAHMVVVISYRFRRRDFWDFSARTVFKNLKYHFSVPKMDEKKRVVISQRRERRIMQNFEHDRKTHKML